MGRTPVVPEIVEKEVKLEQPPLEVEVSKKEAEKIGLFSRPAKKPRTEKQIEATKKLVERNKEWRAKLKNEKDSGKTDNMVQGLLAEKAEEKEKDGVKIKFKIRKSIKHPRPNHELKPRAEKKRKAQLRPRPQTTDESDVGATTETGEDTEAIIQELRARHMANVPTSRFVAV
jgi:hypothetical protein